MNKLVINIAEYPLSRTFQWTPDRLRNPPDVIGIVFHWGRWMFSFYYNPNGGYAP